jgi:energy-coupling factor transport system permease protein
MTMLVQYFPGDSLLHRLDPRTKVVAVLSAAVSVLAAADWQGLGLAALPVLASLFLTGLAWKRPR